MANATKRESGCFKRTAGRKIFLFIRTENEGWSRRVGSGCLEKSENIIQRFDSGVVTIRDPNRSSIDP